MSDVRKIYGVGVNDADYVVQINETLGYTEEGKQLQKLVWICPYYSRWKSMLERCYSQVYQKKRPNYVGCSTVPEWHYFMIFRSWMEKQDWQAKVLDKDLLIEGNKIYGPDTCLFITSELNSFLTEKKKSTNGLPVGVDFDKRTGKFRAQISENSKNVHIGLFKNAEQAHNAWLQKKIEQAKQLANKQTDIRIINALVSRYINKQEEI